ncbi:hypothetical protein R70723_17075 [Paenibacillus sp. FSL R7-0273]|uniref:DUF116 domain-containing protein n=1 Tax=Paenibacillus sp. FSL R7-0273 TaxID=1536772 RepID=UPI0004F5A337|nr:DUF116 domain-containing protein [Paenibacillus sp. FSL R7-0273]AIQ47413.1 hypothetical protein R70723_17075 [Paenibacillus sp. FSL R7-0273]OMF96033.1 hypothetical protein BK144_05505 [Paenibacillus sp. FSL R7-0273]
MTWTDNEPLTYSLYGSGGKTKPYYTEVARFTDEVLNSLLKEKEIIEQMGDYARDKKLESYSSSIYGLEFLMIGVLWRVYGHNAGAGSVYAGKLLSSLYSLRSRNVRWRRPVDRVKGIAGTLVLSRNPGGCGKLDTVSFSRLTGWLQASGEFREECIRLEHWSDLFQGLPKAAAAEYLSRAVRLAAWFDRRSLEVLGCYTPNVERYIEHNGPRLRWRENRIFCSRERVEYHLNMVGAEIMNREFRGAFMAAQDKSIFLPVCMRKKQGNACKAVPEGAGYRCRSCTRDCRVHIITALSRKYDAKVLIIPHASTAFGKEKASEGDKGIIGIACVLNLISGGYQARRMGYQPQCVLLNQSGCVQHWHPDSGLETAIDLDRLEQILNGSWHY